MKKRWPIAGAGAALGALLWVSVEQGSIRLANGEGDLVVAAGQAAFVGADGKPHIQSSPAIAPAQPSPMPPGDERARARRMADAVRRHARKRAAEHAARPTISNPHHSTATTPSAAGASPAQPPASFVFSPTPRPPAEPRTPEDERRREYLRRTVREQYFPVARECYDELLQREPRAGGKVTLEFAIVGDGDAGVVDRVALRDEETTIDDPEFTLCMQESLYTAIFEPPPPGTSETTVVYPVTLSPE